MPPPMLQLSSTISVLGSQSGSQIKSMAWRLSQPPPKDGMTKLTSSLVNNNLLQPWLNSMPPALPLPSTPPPPPETPLLETPTLWILITEKNQRNLPRKSRRNVSKKDSISAAERKATWLLISPHSRPPHLCMLAPLSVLLPEKWQ